MHHKAIFALAGVFLAVALIVPTTILVLQSQTDLHALIISQNPVGLVTSGNITGNVTGPFPPTPSEIQQEHQTNLIIIAVVEAIFLPLFVVTMYIGINHIHPGHGRPQKVQTEEIAPATS
jgi:hypothetical protein